MSVVMRGITGGEIVIEGRPDLRDHDFGVSRMKRFPPYVFSIGANSALVHKVAFIEAHWWAIVAHGHRLARLHRPALIATTVCNQIKRLEGKYSRTCMVPAPDAVLCGRCHGEPATFGKDGAGTKTGLSRHVAYTRLGCTVKGYPTRELTGVEGFGVSRVEP